MTLTIDVSPETEARLFSEARRLGVEPSDLARQFFDEVVAMKVPAGGAPASSVAENDPLLSRLDALIAAAPKDPQAIREAEEDLYDLMRNMNANRAATGERLPFPEVK